jgi:hypothetical protein
MVKFQKRNGRTHFSCWRVIPSCVLCYVGLYTDHFFLSWNCSFPLLQQCWRERRGRLSPPLSPANSDDESSEDEPPELSPPMGTTPAPAASITLNSPVDDISTITETSVQASGRREERVADCDQGMMQRIEMWLPGPTCHTAVWLLMHVLLSLEKWVFFLLFVVLICVDSTYISGSELQYYRQKALAFFAGLPWSHGHALAHPYTTWVR